MNANETRDYRSLINEYRKNLKGTVDNGISGWEEIIIAKMAKSIHTEEREVLKAAMNYAYDLGFMVGWEKATRPDPKQQHDRSAAPGRDQTGTQDHSCAGHSASAGRI